jgi:centriolar protein POC1
MSSGSVRVYDVRMKKLQQHYVLHDNTTSTCWHPHANFLLSSGKDGKLIVVDVMEGRPLYTIGGHEGAVNCVRFSQDGEYFASGGSDRHVMVINFDCALFHPIKKRILQVWKTNFVK